MRDVRVFGLLIGIELDRRRWLGKGRAALSLLAMLRHPRFPVFAGLCQYEPNVLKITPPLDAGPDEIRAACRTIVEVLDAPLPKVLAAGLGGLLKPSPIRKKGNDEYADDPAHAIVHPIRDPFSRITEFWFDRGWRQLADPAEAPSAEFRVAVGSRLTVEGHGPGTVSGIVQNGALRVLVIQLDSGGVLKRPPNPRTMKLLDG